MTRKENLVSQAEALGLELTGKETIGDLEALLASHREGENSFEEDLEPEQPEPTPEPQAPVADPLLDKHVPVGSKAEVMREKLKAEPKVRVMIPLANGEKAGVTQSVILNGYSLYIRKGEYVEVPESVAEILDLKLKHKMSIEQHPARVKADGQVELQSYGS